MQVVHKMTWRKAILLTVISGISCLTGCGIGSLPTITQPTKPIAILFVESPPVSMAVNATVTVYAAVENSASNSQVNYSISCGSSSACGTSNASNEVGAIVYTAPSVIPPGGTVTITATSAADPTKSISAVIAISLPLRFLFRSNRHCQHRCR